MDLLDPKTRQCRFWRKLFEFIAVWIISVFRNPLSTSKEQKRVGVSESRACEA
jgi:hypothetical protein